MRFCVGPATFHETAPGCIPVAVLSFQKQTLIFLHGRPERGEPFPVNNSLRIVRCLLADWPSPHSLLLAWALLIWNFHGPVQAAQSASKDNSRTRSEVTFNRDIAPVVFNQCSPCHRPTQSGPFNLLSYLEVSKRAQQIVEVTSKRIMPPWLPERGFGEFKEERRLTDEQISLFKRWMDAGLPEGMTSDLPTTPAWPEGWQLGEPDLMVTLAEVFNLPETGRDVWRNFVIPSPLISNRFVRAMEFRPGNKAVHHATMKLDRTSQSRLKDAGDPGPGFGGITLPDTARAPAGHMLNWLPGRAAYRSPEGLPWPFAAGADLVVQLHMQTTGKPEGVRPTIGFWFTDQPPTNQLFAFPLRSRTIDIPAGVGDYRIRDFYQLPVDVRLFWIQPHAHYLGREMKACAVMPDGTTNWLLYIKHWDFNWQGDYVFRQPVQLPKGAEIRMDYIYDNSTNNVWNPNHPPKRVQFGQQSTDEMAELWLQVLTSNRRDQEKLEKDFQIKTLSEMSVYYSHRIHLEPADAYAHGRLGFAKASLGRPAEAVQCYQRSIELAPEDSETRVLLGMTLMGLHRPDQARMEFEKAIGIDPANFLAHGNLGFLHMGLGDLQAAEKHLRTAIALNPRDLTARENLSRVLKTLGKTAR